MSFANKSIGAKVLSVISTGKRAIGNESLALTFGSVDKLTIPTNATYALVVVECVTPTAFTDSTRVARATFGGTAPAVGSAAPAPSATSVGLPLGHLDTFDIDELSNLQKFKITKLENLDTVYIHVQYFTS